MESRDYALDVRFLFTRRWVLFAVAVALLALLAYRLGEWQFGRLEEREASNRVVEENLGVRPTPVARLLSPDRPVAPGLEWRRVSAAGTYDRDETVIVRYQTRDGRSGVDAVVPLVTGSGTALLVNRGWAPTDNVGTTTTDVPAPPSGEVSVVGWVRADATGDSAQVADRSTRAVSSAEIGRTLEAPVFRGFVELQSESPKPAEPMVRAETPDLGEGPHFFYGLQWWFFAALAIFGFGYLAWDERRGAQGQDRRRRPRRRQRARVIPPSTGSMHPVRNEAAGESRKAAARPNSSGRP